eukprot:TRINITY_DN25_c1_g1_i1.p1 TRINITY_DN25_c1_g1~~TRINITY_DN25_c1_g1_i1.p1  ORF type:complete len:204 (+),score=67.27 TRINITY_DN25_c1_g1_i1:262-873(+)
MLCRIVLLALATGAVGLVSELDELNKNDLWVTALESCGNEGRDESYENAVLCQEEVEKAYNSEAGVEGFKACDRDYCLCTGGTFEANGTGVCTGTESCKEDCKCMEQCYANQMECSFRHTVSLYTTNNLAIDYCTLSDITDCVRNTRGAFINECKRGLAQPRSVITWMREPVPQGCNAELVCGSASVLSYSALLLAAMVVLLL